MVIGGSYVHIFSSHLQSLLENLSAPLHHPTNIAPHISIYYGQCQFEVNAYSNKISSVFRPSKFSSISQSWMAIISPPPHDIMKMAPYIFNCYDIFRPDLKSIHIQIKGYKFNSANRLTHSKDQGKGQSQGKGYGQGKPSHIYYFKTYNIK